MEQFINIEALSLGAAISSTSSTSITLASVSGLPSSGTCRFKIDNEIMVATLNGTTTITVTRGAEGTTAAVHSNGATVAIVLTAGALYQSRADTISAGTTADRPAAGSAGRMYRCTDSPFLCIDNGTSWDLYYGAVKCTPPVMSDFTQIGVTAETTYASNGDATYVYFNSENITSHGYASAYVLELPTGTSWECTIGIIPVHGLAMQSFMSPVFWETSTGKTAYAGYQYNSNPPSFSLLNLNLGSGTASYIANNGDESCNSEQMRFIKFTYTNGNSNVQILISPDGINFIFAESLAFSGFFTTAPTHIGFGLDPITSFFSTGMVVFHFQLETVS